MWTGNDVGPSQGRGRGTKYTGVENREGSKELGSVRKQRSSRGLESDPVIGKENRTSVQNRKSKRCFKGKKNPTSELAPGPIFCRKLLESKSVLLKFSIIGFGQFVLL